MKIQAKRAMIACENSGHNILDDFAEVSKIVEDGATKKLPLNSNAKKIVYSLL
jgi:hypothetical protein